MAQPADVLSLSSGLYAVPIIIGSGLTLLACGVVLALYRRYEELRRHPASLVVVRVAFDFALALLLICEQVTRLSLASGGAGGGYDTTASCRTYAFWFQCVARSRAARRAVPPRAAARNPFASSPARSQVAARRQRGVVPRHVARPVLRAARPLRRLQEEQGQVHGGHCRRLHDHGRRARRPEL